MRLVRRLLVTVGICMCAAAQTPDSEGKALVDDLRVPALRQQGVDAAYQSAVYNLWAKRYREAEDAFRMVYRKEPQSVRAIEGIARVYLSENRNAEAIRLIEAEVASHPERLDLLLAFVRIAEEVSDYDIAIAALTGALGTVNNTKDRTELYRRIGRIYEKKTDFKSSLEALRQARRLVPGDLWVAIDEARVLEMSGQADEAMSIYRTALGGDPHEPAVADALGLIYLRQAMTAEAIRIYEDITSRQPASSTYRHHLALAFSQNGERAKARAELQRALELNPSDEEKRRIQRLVEVLDVPKQQ